MSDKVITGYGGTGEVHEKDEAIIDGMDVSGSWNRMIDERVITENRDIESLEDALEFFGKEDDPHRCIQCGSCTSVCTMHAQEPDFDPRFWVYLARTGREEALVENRDLVWKCVSCLKCVNVCPGDVEPEGIMKVLSEWLQEQGYSEETTSHKFDESFWNEVKETGRMEEGHLILNYFKATGQPLRQDWLETFGKRIAKRLPIRHGIAMAKNYLFHPRTRSWNDDGDTLESYVEEKRRDAYE